jgi:dihydroorotate dehydrogenase
MLRSLRQSVVRTALAGTAMVVTVEVTTKLPSQGRSSLFYHYLADEIATPLLRRVLDPEQAHAVAIYFAKHNLSPRYHPSSMEQSVDLQTTVFGITFGNPIGLAAGFDKDAEVPLPLLQMGFGSVEVGSITPLPQPGNPKPRMYRLTADGGIINRYGFNSQGMEAVAKNLKEFRYGKQEIIVAKDEESSSSQPLHQMLHYAKVLTTAAWHVWQLVFPGPTYRAPLIVGVNLGKNKDSTSELEDYQMGIRTLGEYADYLVINVSSPNTPGLRDLQQPDALRALLEAAMVERSHLNKHVPLLVKLAPDLTKSELIAIAETVMSCGIDGLIVSNTTNARPTSLVSSHKSEPGGLSGMPLRERSTECIRILYTATRGELPIVGVGGISNARDVMEKLKAGASLVQVYSVLAFEGPGVVSRLRHELAVLIRQEGFKSVADVVGHDHEDVYWKRQQIKLETRVAKIGNDEHEQQLTLESRAAEAAEHEALIVEEVSENVADEESEPMTAEANTETIESHDIEEGEPFLVEE